VLRFVVALAASPARTSRRRPIRRLGLLTLPFVLASPCARAQVPAGAEFRVNTYTYFVQNAQSMAAGPDGSFVVVWERAGEGDGFGIFGQRFNPRGGAIGAEFRVNTYTTGSQSGPAVARDSRGRFVVVWEGMGEGDNLGVFGQRFGVDGQAVGAPFRVNTYTGFEQWNAAVTMQAHGRFVVVWESSPGGPESGIFAQRFDAEGNPTGSEFQVDSGQPSLQSFPAVAASAGGDFVVAWGDYGQSDGSSNGVFAQRFSAAGERLGAPFAVPVYTTGPQGAVSVAASSAGAFVIAWGGWGFNGTGLFARAFDASGSPDGSEFRVDAPGGFSPASAAAGIDASGAMVIAGWRASAGADRFEVFARRFERGGAPRGAEFKVSALLPSFEPAVSCDADGNFIVAWNVQQPVTLDDVHALRYGGLHAAALVVDGGGNGVLEAGEAAQVRPSWRNESGATQAVTASLRSFGGPPGASYLIEDGDADYGAIMDGVTAPCVECYSLRVSLTGPRPSLHWDASTLEKLAPDAQGQSKPWTLHVGDSFADVARASQYYRFVETMLHHSIVIGCSSQRYCPADPVRRDQLAVVTLVAKEGAGYAPPACGSPVFADVPATSPFCPYIEELARRGVVSGCGGGKYCPAAVVPREQMPVFLLRTLEPGLDPPFCGTPMFSDVPASNPYCRWIEELARRGIVGGCGGGNYCPSDAVTREQMSVFVVGTFGLALYAP
jgi:hypothetical protein